MLQQAARSTAFGLYEFYSAFTMWPKVVREDLRAGVKAKHQGNLNTSVRYLTRALETALALPLDELSPNPHAKLSGIAIVLGEVLELANKPAEAYDVYAAALLRLQNAMKKPTSVPISGPERVRAASLAFKLGEMAEMYSQPEEEEERWLTFAVEEMLRILRDTQSPEKSRDVTESGSTNSGKQSVDLDELELPAWVGRDDVVAPLEKLGAFYNRQGKQEWAVPLYLSALSVLLPANTSRDVPPETKCQGAHIMNSLAASLAAQESTSAAARISQSEKWAEKAIALVNSAKSSNLDAEVSSYCDAVLVAALFNMGSLKEMNGESFDAKQWYTSSHKLATSVGERGGIMEAEQALRRLNRPQRGKQDTQSGKL
ncbi:hypothetical protein EIP91_012388 [Steccherinum ochraceum]|uniref:Uncharacterized protein n=1 Tax=Steccherinum ochraceum TaxID=92696 RepID=A0A4R0RIX5_9APHY|nr:hypothetical protein EIP91_012388 [Steccherinum ochraceum]